MKADNQEIIHLAEESEILEAPPQQNNVLAELKAVESGAQRIKGQNSFGAFFQAGKNTKELAENFGRLANITKWEINTLLLILNAHTKRKEEYDAIQNSLSGLEESLSDDVEQKEYLAKVKTALSRIKERDEACKKLEKKVKILTVLSAVAIVLAVVAIVIRFLPF